MTMRRTTATTLSALRRRPAPLSLRAAAAAPWKVTTVAMSTVVEGLRSTPSSPPPPPPVAGSHEHVHAQRQQKAQEILRDAVAAKAPRNNWTKEEIAAIYYQPLMELAFQAVSHAKIPRLTSQASNLLTPHG